MISNMVWGKKSQKKDNDIYVQPLREAFKNKNDKTYGIFHMLVDPPPNIWKIYRYFLLSKNDF